MEQSSNKKELHVRIDPELYQKFRHIVFYERNSMTEVVARLIAEYVEEKALDEAAGDLAAPMVL
jgi:cell wall assembly regulator SMI1